MTRYLIDPAESEVTIEASSSVHPIHSRTTGLEGWLDLSFDRGGRLGKASHPGAHLELPVARLRSSNPLEERELKRRIDARHHPTISGDLTSIERLDDSDAYRATGTVTFLGRAVDHTDELTITRDDDGGVRVGGRSTFDVRDFGMQPPRILVLKVHPEVTVTLSVVARPSR